MWHFAAVFHWKRQEHASCRKDLGRPVFPCFYQTCVSFVEQPGRPNLSWPFEAETADNWPLHHNILGTPVTYYAAKCVVETHLIFLKVLFRNDVSLFLPRLAKSQKPVNELSCSCQYFWSLLANQHMFDASKAHRRPLFKLSGVSFLLCGSPAL